MSRVSGLPQIIASFKRMRARHASGVARGLKLGGIEVLRASQRYVPVDLGDLKATGHVRTEGSGFETVVIIAYGMRYAMWVHEDLEKAHGSAYNTKYAAQIKNKEKYWYKGAWRTYHRRGPNQQAKFLERGVQESRAAIVAHVRTEAAKP